MLPEPGGGDAPNLLDQPDTSPSQRHQPMGAGLSTRPSVSLSCGTPAPLPEAPWDGPAGHPLPESAAAPPGLYWGLSQMLLL